MQEPQTKRNKSFTSQIPNREEFHRQWGGEIMLADFDTAKPNPLRLKYLYTAWLVNEKHKKGKEDGSPIHSHKASD